MDIQAIWQNFHDTVVHHYFDMRGRVGRAQFWYFALVSVLLSVFASVLKSVSGLPLPELFNLAMILPWAGMGARRLQDRGRDGRLVWLYIALFAATQIVGIVTALAFIAAGPLGLLFAPGLGVAVFATLVVGMVLVYFWVQPGNAHDNAYGPPPPIFEPSARPTA